MPKTTKTKPEEIAEEMLSKDTFNAMDAVKDVSYPTDSVRVYTQGALAHEMNELIHQAEQIRLEAKGYSAAVLKQMADDPKMDELLEEADALDARVQEILKQVVDSALTFHVRGISPVQLRLIDKKWRKAIKPPVRKNYEDTPEGEEEYELEILERNIERNNKVNSDVIACSIVKVVNGKGQEDTKAWTVAKAEKLFDSLLESEWYKIKRLAEDLTGAHTLFNNTVTQDADFLSKP